jgi:hypothetical protein
MNGPQIFPLKLSPLRGESLRGYMHRFALRNAIPYINWIVIDVGLKNISTALTPEQIARLACMTRTPFEDLSNRQAIQANGETLLLGERICQSMVEREASRLCLHCFQEEAYHRLIWDIIPVSICPIHGTPITRHCPDCGMVLYWRRNHLHRCPAGHSLLKERPARCDAIDERELVGVRAVYERFGIHEGWAPTTLPWNEGELPAWDLIDMLELLGRLASGCLGHARRSSRSAYGSNGYHLILGRGCQIASDWPRAFHRVLDEQSTMVSGLWLADSSHPVRKILHRQLSRQERPNQQVLGREIWRYAETKGITLSAGAFGFEPADFERRFVSSTKARSLMQVSTEVLQRIARDERWPGATQLSTGRFVWLRRTDIDTWCLNHRNGMSATKLARRFHISQAAILDMARLGLFGSEARDRRPAQLKARWHALPSEADLFIDYLRSALTHQFEEGVNYVNWMGFTKRPESRFLTIADIVAAIARKQVRAVSMIGESLPSLRFNLDDALALARQHVPAGSLASHDETKISFRQITARFHVQYPFLMQAIALGVLSAEEQRDGVVRYWVRPSDMECFLKQFTTVSLLARQFGKSAASVCSALRQLKVHPYGADGMDPSVPKLFARSDIDVAGLRRVLAKSKNGVSQHLRPARHNRLSAPRRRSVQSSSIPSKPNTCEQNF